MMTERTAAPIDLDRALLDPGSAFAVPADVVAHPGLTSLQKIEILRRWQYDAAEDAVAVEEGMRGEDNDLLRRILLALEQLSGGPVGEHTGPTKQHGLGVRSR